MSFVDKTLVCQDCGGEFIFTVGEQEFYEEKGFKNEPKRCGECRKSRKRDKSEPDRRKLFSVICSECGCETQVPFEPRGDRPIYCRSCFEAQRAG